MAGYRHLVDSSLDWGQVICCTPPAHSACALPRAPDHAGGERMAVACNRPSSPGRPPAHSCAPSHGVCAARPAPRNATGPCTTHRRHATRHAAYGAPCVPAWRGMAWRRARLAGPARSPPLDNRHEALASCVPSRPAHVSLPARACMVYPPASHTHAEALMQRVCTHASAPNHGSYQEPLGWYPTWHGIPLSMVSEPLGWRNRRGGRAQKTRSCKRNRHQCTSLTSAPETQRTTRYKRASIPVNDCAPSLRRRVRAFIRRCCGASVSEGADARGGFHCGVVYRSWPKDMLLRCGMGRKEILECGRGLV